MGYLGMMVSPLPPSQAHLSSSSRSVNWLIIDFLFCFSLVVDSGAMGSYVFFYLSGLYPLPATNQFLLSSPYFKSITFKNPLLGTKVRLLSDGNFGRDGFVYVKVWDSLWWGVRCLLIFGGFCRAWKSTENHINQIVISNGIYLLLPRLPPHHMLLVLSILPLLQTLPPVLIPLPRATRRLRVRS